MAVHNYTTRPKNVKASILNTLDDAFDTIEWLEELGIQGAYVKATGPNSFSLWFKFIGDEHVVREREALVLYNDDFEIFSSSEFSNQFVSF